MATLLDATKIQNMICFWNFTKTWKKLILNLHFPATTGKEVIKMKTPLKFLALFIQIL